MPVFDKPPSSDAQWREEAERAGVRETSLRAYPHHQSASKTTPQQFLTFRTLIIPQHRRQLNPAHWNMGNLIHQAEILLANSPDFQSFLQSMNNPNVIATGDFAPLLKQREEILLGLNKRGKLERIDESVVNATLINFLQAISGVAPTPTVTWRHSRYRFYAGFRTPAHPNRGMTAITDGQLQTRGIEMSIRALIEAKKDGHRRPNVDRQEGALLMAWIREFPLHPERRVLVSQDGLQVYVSFVSEDWNWRDYLILNRIQRLAYMRVWRYGPWDLRNVDHVRDVARILLAICL